MAETKVTKRQIRISQHLVLKNDMRNPPQTRMQTPPKTTLGKAMVNRRESSSGPLKEKMLSLTTRFSKTELKSMSGKSSALSPSVCSPLPAKSDQEHYENIIKELKGIIKQKDLTISELQKRVKTLHKECEGLRKTVQEAPIIQKMKSLNSTTTLASTVELKPTPDRQKRYNLGICVTSATKVKRDFYSPKAKGTRKKTLSESLSTSPHYKTFFTPCKSPESIQPLSKCKKPLERLKKRLIGQLYSMKWKIEDLTERNKVLEYNTLEI